MKVKVIAPFEIAGREADGTLELRAGARVRDVFKKAPVYSLLLPVSVNGKQVSRSHVLKEGDLVVVITPISGG